mmetsp:Transcript_11294/g.25942  ORF Transcript_11294/g.25942 Transcript_11294/m.25942 type:complete len:971 (+) Transcript_11294:113-3025(+)
MFARALLLLLGLLVLQDGRATSTELTYAEQLSASTGTHTLTIEEVPFSTSGFNTRGFNGGVPGPTFRVDPGETLRITFVNSLSSSNNVGCDVTGTQFCDTATSNLHTHGLHVSSRGKLDGLSHYADDIFASVAPGGSENFEFAIPSYHMPGTHWYHPHHHHATALQAGGGAAGVIIVNDPSGYLPTEYENMVERIIMISGHNLQTMQGMAEDSQSNLWSDAVNIATTNDFPTNVFLVNGQLGPTVTLSSHIWYRFRMVYAAVEQSLNLAATGSTNGGACTFQLMAKDGVYLPTMPRQVTTIHLFPGARADVGVSCTCSTYPCEVTIGSSSGGRRLSASRPRRIQKTGPGDGGAPPDGPGADPVDVDVMTLSITETTNGEVVTLPSTTVQRPCYLVDLTAETVSNDNSGRLDLRGGDRLVTWDGTGSSMTYEAVHADGNDKHDWPAIGTFQVGTVYELEITGADAHPFHIHINPYQISSLPGGPYGDGYFQVGDWHDTLLISDMTDGVTVRMQTDVFTGKMVAHCHILEHEDEGMMAWFQITGQEGATWSGAEAIDSQCLRSAFVASDTDAVTVSTSSSTSTTTSRSTMSTKTMSTKTTTSGLTGSTMSTSTTTSAAEAMFTTSTVTTSSTPSTTSTSSSTAPTTVKSTSTHTSTSSGSSRLSMTSSTSTATTTSTVSSTSTSPTPLPTTKMLTASTPSSRSTESTVTTTSSTATSSSTEPITVSTSSSSISSMSSPSSSSTTSTSVSSQSSRSSPSTVSSLSPTTPSTVSTATVDPDATTTTTTSTSQFVVISGSLTLSFSDGAAEDFVTEYENGVVTTALKESVAGPLDDVDAADVTIVGVQVVNSRRLLPKALQRRLQAPASVLVSFEINLAQAATTLTEDEVINTLQSSVGLAVVASTLNAGLLVAAVTFTVSQVDVDAVLLIGRQATTSTSTTTTPLQESSDACDISTIAAFAIFAISSLWQRVVR